MEHRIEIGVIGGSGLYAFSSAKVIDEVEIDTPFGKPSDKITIVDVEGRKVAFLPRHGRGHIYPPTKIPMKANIWALKFLGVRKLIGVSAVGSLREELKPMEFVIPSQLIDFTRWRELTFFSTGLVGHVSMADPFCNELSRQIKEIASKHLPEIVIHTGKTYITIEGPQFSSRAESNLFRQWGADVIGMTASGEAKLAREAEMCYSLISMVTDYDCWYEGHEDVNAEMVMEYMRKNTDNILKLLPVIIKNINISKCSCEESAKFAIVTSKDRIPQEIKRALAIFYEKYWS
ncbi:MAG: S-methyl-5'-thioadenosine phosphorylase [Brevinematia bacterium]